jgi:surface protein
LLLLVVCGLGGVEGFAKLPNGDGSNSDTGTSGTLRRAVSDWIAGGALQSTVNATYGPIEDWDVSEVKNMKLVFYNFYTFNEDLSKWNTGAVTTMQGSKCIVCLFPWSHLFQFSHVLFLFCFWMVLLLLLCVVLFLAAPTMAVFTLAVVFNRDLSKWNTGAVTDMGGSKCMLSFSFFWNQDQFSHVLLFLLIVICTRSVFLFCF